MAKRALQSQKFLLISMRNFAFKSRRRQL